MILTPHVDHFDANSGAEPRIRIFHDRSLELAVWIRLDPDVPKPDQSTPFRFARARIEQGCQRSGRRAKERDLKSETTGQSDRRGVRIIMEEGVLSVVA